MKFTAAGDAIIQRRIQSDFEGYSELCPFIKDADASFFNLETTLNYEGEANSSRLSGGTYIRTNPDVLEDLKRFGFNMTSFNNNHALDYSYDGLLKTIEYVNKSGLIHTGVGRNLAEASAPRYLETNGGRIALISINTTFNMAMMAGAQTERIKGRPGINGIRHTHTSYVTKEEFEMIKSIAEKTNINAANEIYIKEGYRMPNPENMCSYGDENFCVGDTCCVKNTLNKNDMQRLENSIYEAKLQADYIMISVHSHELSGDKKENPSDFLVELSHKCIDLGAHAVIGHGPHLLRPIEVYKDCPIFYSLGDFILQLYNLEYASAELYENNGLTHDKTLHELLKTRSHNFTIGLMEDIKMAETVIPMWETDENGKLKSLKLLPITLDMKGNKSQQGLPRRDYNPAFAQRVADISKPYGVEITLNAEGLLECKW